MTVFYKKFTKDYYGALINRPLAAGIREGPTEVPVNGVIWIFSPDKTSLLM